MKKILAALAILIGTAGVAAACPAWQNAGFANYYTTGDDLYSPNAYNVVAGGNVSLRNCDWNHTGWLTSRPTAEIRIDGLERYGRIQFRAVSDCDTVLFINDSLGEWWFDDDGFGNLNPELTMPNPGSGVYHVWVGTYGGGSCNAQLQIETWYN